MSGLSQKVCYDFRRQISEKINRLPLAYFEKRTVGEVLSRITNDVGHPGPEPEPEHHPADHQRHHHDRCAHHDALHQRPDDPHRPADPAGVAGAGHGGGPLQPAVLQGPAGPPWAWSTARWRRVYAGHNVIKAFNRGAGGARRFQHRQRPALRLRLEEPVPLRPDDAHHELCGQPGLCGGGHRGQHLCGGRAHHHRRYPGLHPVREELHPAHPAAVPGVQHAPEHGGRRRARL